MISSVKPETLKLYRFRKAEYKAFKNMPNEKANPMWFSKHAEHSVAAEP